MVFKKGQSAWNKGLTKESSPSIKSMSLKRVEKKERLGYINSPEARKKMSKAKKGIPQTEESNNKRRKSMKKAWEEEKFDILERNKNISNSRKGIKFSEDHKNKLSLIKIENYRSGKLVHWAKFFQSLLAERYEYKYSENGGVIVNLGEAI